VKREPARSKPGSKITDMLHTINPDEMTPIQALETLYRLKVMLTED